MVRGSSRLEWVNAHCGVKHPPITCALPTSPLTLTLTTPRTRWPNPAPSRTLSLTPFQLPFPLTGPLTTPRTPLFAGSPLPPLSPALAGQLFGSPSTSRTRPPLFHTGPGQPMGPGLTPAPTPMRPRPPGSPLPGGSVVSYPLVAPGWQGFFPESRGGCGEGML